MHSTQDSRTVKFALGDREVRLHLPHSASGTSAHDEFGIAQPPAAVTLVKHGTLGEQDLPVLARLMTMTNDLRRVPSVRTLPCGLFASFKPLSIYPLVTHAVVIRH